MNEHETQPHGGSPSSHGPMVGGPTAPVAEPAGQPSHDARILGALAHGLTFLEGGLIGPLIIYLVKKDDDFVAFHALQSLYFGLLFLAISAVTCGFGALVLVWPYLIYEAVATFKAYEGEYYELPIVGKWARRSHPGDGASAGPVEF